MGDTMRKHVIGHVWTAKANISLRICAVWSGPSLSSNNHWILQNVCKKTKGQDETLHMCRMIWICAFAHVRKHFCLTCNLIKMPIWFSKKIEWQALYNKKLFEKIMSEAIGMLLIFLFLLLQIWPLILCCTLQLAKIHLYNIRSV